MEMVGFGTMVKDWAAPWVLLYLSPLAGLVIYNILNQGLTPLAISPPALRACILMVFENAVNELRCPVGVAFSVAPYGAFYL